MSGEVVLKVPADFPMDLDLEIAYTRDSRKSFKIFSSLILFLKEQVYFLKLQMLIWMVVKT